MVWPSTGDRSETLIATTSMLPFLRAPRGIISPGSICCSKRLKMICVLETVVSIPSLSNNTIFAGSLTRATVRGAWKFFFAIWQMTRLSSSSPVTATITSARPKPASAMIRTSHPSPCITTSPSCSAIAAWRRRSFSSKRTSWPSVNSFFVR